MPQGRTDKNPTTVDDATGPGLLATVATQMQSSWEKKRKERESKYLHNAKEELEKCIFGRSEEYTDAITELNSAYEKFVFEYAQVEDDIRKLWMQLLQEQQKLLALSERKSKAARENDEERERGQVKGMAVAKKAVEDFGHLISSVEHSF
ncbi:hypothetical protein C8Q80DRAFT_1190498 [Daedaleopsis nitida]|nr:hypothetical protein C8Q80DRAFT_1190498 [Daedaleopsis nitida]